MPAVAPRQLVAQERFVPGIHSVQGINSRIEDVKLRGAPLVAHIGEAIAEATLRRKIVGASELELLVRDPGRRLLRSALLEEAHELTLDGLRWKLVKVASEGVNEPMTMLYEPLIVYLLKQLKGPAKAFRELMTRAEFAKSRAFQARPRPRFISPELHVVQDIATAEKGREAKAESEQARGKGIGLNPTLKINTRPATKEQLNILDRMLRVGESLGASTKAVEAMVATVIVESVVGLIASNLMGQNADVGVGTDHSSPEDCAEGFLRGYKTAYGRSEGAIQVARENPSMPVYEIAQEVQKSGAGLASNGKSNYGKFEAEAKVIVSAYGGGADDIDASVEAVMTQRYAFQQSKKESNWRCMNRLAGEVNWRCFESASWIYFMAEPTLLRSHRRMLVSDVAPGIVDTTFDYDVGKEVTEVVVEAQAKVWGAPPGSVAVVSRHGPANGLYIVETIESHPSSRSGLAQITLKKPTEPLPEPAPKRTTSSVSFGASGGDTAGVPPKVAAIIDFIDRCSAGSASYLWGGGHGGFASPGDRMDCSGFVSAALHAAGYLSTPVTSGVFSSLFPNGEGEWVTVYGNSTHVFMAVKYPDGTWRYAGTGGSPGAGAWVDDSNGTSGAPARGDKIASHPPGL